jgi:hypothetical protein
LLDVVTVDAEDFEFDETAFDAHDLADGVVTLWAILVSISSPSQEIWALGHRPWVTMNRPFGCAGRSLPERFSPWSYIGELWVADSRS